LSEKLETNDGNANEQSPPFVWLFRYGQTNATKPQIKLASRRTTRGGQESVGCPLFNPA